MPKTLKKQKQKQRRSTRRNNRRISKSMRRSKRRNSKPLKGGMFGMPRLSEMNPHKSLGEYLKQQFSAPTYTEYIRNYGITSLQALTTYIEKHKETLLGLGISAVTLAAMVAYRVPIKRFVLNTSSDRAILQFGDMIETTYSEIDQLDKNLTTVDNQIKELLVQSESLKVKFCQRIHMI